MECPYCFEELEYEDYFGRYLGLGHWDKKGEIYKCPNQDCESQVFNFYFYIWNDDTRIYEGYPC